MRTKKPRKHATRSNDPHERILELLQAAEALPEVTPAQQLGAFDALVTIANWKPPAELATAHRRARPKIESLCANVVSWRRDVAFSPYGALFDAVGARACAHAADVGDVVPALQVLLDEEIAHSKFAIATRAAALAVYEVPFQGVRIQLPTVVAPAADVADHFEPWVLVDGSLELVGATPRGAARYRDAFSDHARSLPVLYEGEVLQAECWPLDIAAGAFALLGRHAELVVPGRVEIMQTYSSAFFWRGTGMVEPFFFVS